MSQTRVCELTIISLPDSWLNAGNNAIAAIKAITVAAKATKIDSIRNCAIRCFFNDPKTLRTPTSRALFADLAVERFMKLTQAINSINRAIAEKMYTYCVVPLGPSSPVRFDLR